MKVHWKFSLFVVLAALSTAGAWLRDAEAGSPRVKKIQLWWAVCFLSLVDGPRSGNPARRRWKSPLQM
jgi:hypothetical protein